MIVIDESGDLPFKVIQRDDSVRSIKGQPPIIPREEQFLVSKQVIMDSSRVLHMELIHHQNSKQAKEIFTTEEDRIVSMRLWLEVLHQKVSDGSYSIVIDEMWHLAAASDKYEFDISELYTWFGEWISRQRVHLMKPQFLLYPCWRYQNAQGFLDATRRIVYGRKATSQKAIRPTSISSIFLVALFVSTSSSNTRHLSLQPAEQINAAKGRLRTILHAFLFKPVELLLEADCDCKEKTLFGYIKALHSTGVWPLDPVWPKEEVTQILNRLASFSYEAPDGSCSEYCQQEYEGMVNTAQNTTRKYFDGLCLDCMDRSKPKTGDEDNDYWKHNELQPDAWDRGCRVKHGEPTWYFSFMGRREKRDQLLKNMRYKRRHGSGMTELNS